MLKPCIDNWRMWALTGSTKERRLEVNMCSHSRGGYGTGAIAYLRTRPQNRES